MEDSETKMRRRSQTTAVCPKGAPNKRPSFYANERFFQPTAAWPACRPLGGIGEPRPFDCHCGTGVVYVGFGRLAQQELPYALCRSLRGGRCQRDRSRSDGIRLDLAGRQKTLIGESAPANMAMLVKNTAAQGLAVPSLKPWQAPEGSDGQRGAKRGEDYIRCPPRV